MARRSGTELGLVLLGLLAWAVAGMFAILIPTLEVELPTSTGTVKVRAANPAVAGVSGGFAIAGGLCMLGAALAGRDDRRNG
jgi:hypothetical protein